MQFNKDAPAGYLVKTTLVDYPGRLASAFFLYGCNLRCPYCYNTDLVNNSEKEEAVSVSELYSHLEKRKNVLSGLVLSGGEALLFPGLEEIIEKAKSLGYKIKLDTNGTLPEKLSELIKNPDTKPDYIAMDIKTSPQNYSVLLGNKKEPSENSEKINNELENKICKSINILSELPPEEREFRTVLVPPLVKLEDIQNISKLLPENATWFLASFKNENCLDHFYETINPYTENEEKELLKEAQKIIKNTSIR